MRLSEVSVELGECHLHVWEYGGESVEAKEAQAFATRLEFPNIECLISMIQKPDISQEELDAYISGI